MPTPRATRPPDSERLVTDPAALPERLRLRVVALVSAVLPSVTPLPPSLRKVAGFAPAKRARVGAATIWASLQDDDFRQHAAVQVAAMPALDDPVDAASRAWLTRDDGWEALVAEVAAQLADEPHTDDPDQVEIERLNALVAALQSELAAARDEHRAQADQAKADYAVLRRRLGDARSVLRAAETERDEARSERDLAAAEARSTAQQAESDVRRLRAQLDELESGLASTRRDTRTAKDNATIRARYLLETVIEAATGLRRELGLPAVDGAPGDAVEAGLSGGDGARTSSAPATPAILEQTLSMPRSRLIIDGYNVTMEAWPSASLEAQRSRLVSALAAVVARTGAETTVVFDAASSGSRSVMPSPRGVKVVFSPVGVIADDVIRRLVDAEPSGRVVVVVTSDQELADDVARDGARVIPSRVLVNLIRG